MKCRGRNFLLQLGEGVVQCRMEHNTERGNDTMIDPETYERLASVVESKLGLDGLDAFHSLLMKERFLSKLSLVQRENPEKLENWAVYRCRLVLKYQDRQHAQRLEKAVQHFLSSRRHVEQRSSVAVEGILATLDDQQKRVALLLADGFTVREIAEKLGKSRGYVERQLRKIRNALAPFVR